MRFRALSTSCLALFLAACGGGGSSTPSSSSGPSDADSLLAAQLITQYQVVLSASAGQLGRFAMAVLVHASQPRSFIVESGPCDNSTGSYQLTAVELSGSGGLPFDGDVRLVGQNCLLSAMSPCAFDGTIVITPLADIPSPLPSVGPATANAKILTQGFTLTVQGSSTAYLSMLAPMTATVDAGAGTSNVTFAPDPRVSGSSINVSGDAVRTTNSITLVADIVTLTAIETPTSFSYSLSALDGNIAQGTNAPTAQVAFTPKTALPITGTFNGDVPTATAGAYEGDQFAGSATAITIQVQPTSATVNGHIATTWSALLGL
jgi:hypothetical protein